MVCERFVSSNRRTRRVVTGTAPSQVRASAVWGKIPFRLLVPIVASVWSISVYESSLPDLCELRYEVP
jgi:hypothetical protein